jgi:hypothetical protein
MHSQWQASLPYVRRYGLLLLGIAGDEAEPVEYGKAATAGTSTGKNSNSNPTLRHDAASAAATFSGGPGDLAYGGGAAISKHDTIWWRLMQRWRPAIFDWLPEYNMKRYLPRDVLAGVTIGILLIPQGLAYSTLAGLPPVYGIYSGFPAVCEYFIPMNYISSHIMLQCMRYSARPAKLPLALCPSHVC